MKKGNHHSKETRNKISKSLKGCIPWNKGLTIRTDERVKRYGEKVSKNSARFWEGKHHTEDTKRKMSEAHKGIITWNAGLTKETDERMKQISKSLKGRKLSKETKEKISESLSGEGHPNYKKHRAKETKRKISLAKMNHEVTSETKKKMSLICIKRYAKFEHPMKGKQHSKKSREKMSKSRVKNMLKNAGPYVNTSIERKIKSQLSKNNIGFQQQYVIKNKIYDFYIPDLNLLIEADGMYFHNLPKNILRDKEKNQIASMNSYGLLRIREDTINSENFNVLNYLF